MSDGLAESLAAYMARPHRRDEETIAAITGATEDLRRSRAARILGTDDREAASWRAVLIRRKARQTGVLGPDEIEALLAAERLTGERSEIARDAEQAATAAGVVFDL